MRTIIQHGLTRLGSAKVLTRDGSGTLFFEPDAMQRWDLA